MTNIMFTQVISAFQADALFVHDWQGELLSIDPTAYRWLAEMAPGLTFTFKVPNPLTDEAEQTEVDGQDCLIVAVATAGDVIVKFPMEI
jgi:hypothetical protein